MVEETFIAANPREAFELARDKYGNFSNLKLLKAVQIKDKDKNLVSKITVSVSSDEFLNSIGLDEEEELASEIVDLKAQMNRMKNLMNPNAHRVDNMRVDNIEKIEIVKAQMLEKGLCKEWIDETLKDIIDTDIAEDEELIRSYILDEVDEQICVKAEDMSKTKIMMLIGSTGVGKTTTIAKLAARYSMMLDRPLKVALVNLDTFRVGAHEQLEHYAKSMYLKHIKMEKLDEFANTLDSLEGYDVILIDTAGISPYDTEKLIKTIEFLKNSKNHIIDSTLVISATAKRYDIVDIYEHFSFLNISSVILTKFDETKRVGELFSFLIEKSIPVSYISSGQNVPYDLVPADKEKLMERFIGELNV